MKQNLRSPAPVYTVICVTVKSVRCFIKGQMDTSTISYFFYVTMKQSGFYVFKIYRNVVEVMQKLTLTQYSEMRNT